jgi:hypothetical protein
MTTMYSYRTMYSYLGVYRGKDFLDYSHHNKHYLPVWVSQA